MLDKSKLKRSTLKDEVYTLIKDSILHNELLPGEELKINSLAEELDTSHTPVRETLARLKGEGLVKEADNDTAIVTPISKKDVNETYQARKLLEPYVVGLAAQKGYESEEKAKIEKLKRDMEMIPSLEYRESVDLYHETGLRLNDLIMEELDNDLVEEMFSFIDNYNLRIRLLAESSNESLTRESIRSGNEEHLEMLNGIEKCNVDKAKKAARIHLENAKQRTLEVMELESWGGQ